MAHSGFVVKVCRSSEGIKGRGYLPLQGRGLLILEVTNEGTVRESRGMKITSLTGFLLDINERHDLQVRVLTLLIRFSW